MAIASRLFEICHLSEADCVVLLTGDTDLAPAVRTCRRLFPQMIFLFAFPYKRVNDELRAIAHRSFKISPAACLRHQYPDPLRLADGTSIAKPVNW